MSRAEKIENYVREVVVNYRGPKRKSPAFDEAEAVVKFLKETLTDNSREHFIVLFLDTCNRIISYSIASIGTQTRCVVGPVEIFQRAVLLGATSLIVAHNHPNGSTKPSRQDLEVTKNLNDAAQLLSITLLDHIIFTEDDHFSFYDSGLLRNVKLKQN